MLQRDLKKTANESIFNPKCPPSNIKFIIEAGNPNYWVTRAQELLIEANSHPKDFNEWQRCLKDATTLLILARTFVYEENKIHDKTGDNTSG